MVLVIGARITIAGPETQQRWVPRRLGTIPMLGLWVPLNCSPATMPPVPRQTLRLSFTLHPRAAHSTRKGRRPPVHAPKQPRHYKIGSDRSGRSGRPSQNGGFLLFIEYRPSARPSESKSGQSGRCRPMQRGLGTKMPTRLPSAVPVRLPTSQAP